MEGMIILSTVYGIRREVTKGDTVVGVCYGLPSQEEKLNKAFLKKPGSSQSHALLLMVGLEPL